MNKKHREALRGFLSRIEENGEDPLKICREAQNYMASLDSDELTELEKQHIKNGIALEDLRFLYYNADGYDSLNTSAIAKKVIKKKTVKTKHNIQDIRELVSDLDNVKQIISRLRVKVKKLEK